MSIRLQLNPATRKRLSRFRRFRRAYVSAWLLAIIFTLTLCADLLCNDKPIFVRFDGKSYFPVLRYYAESEFLPEGKDTRPNYKLLQQSPTFTDNAANTMIFPPIPFGARETISEESLKAQGRVVVRCIPIPKAGNINLSPALSIKRARSPEIFFHGLTGTSIKGEQLDTYWDIDDVMRKAIQTRFQNKAAPALRQTTSSLKPPRMTAELSLSEFKPRSAVPKTVRLTLRTPEKDRKTPQTFVLNETLTPNGKAPAIWEALTEADRTRVQERAKACRTHAVNPIRLHIGTDDYQVLFDNSIAWPHPPVHGHWLGIDSAGRDVLARIVHGLRISLIFSILLVISSMTIGICTGAIQGYFGGVIDITGQRFTEIWSAIPFLYVMILLGSIYGSSFWLLLLCYAIFNWIGISYYMRAEFLRLRKRPFVDAARVLGVSSRAIIFRHILPNAVTPIITFIPFSLVGAIASLAALDYLGFGLPALTPSLGQLLHQAQANRSAWWLILYPSLALFIVMLLGVFIGEGIREAYDPRPRSRME